MSEENYGWNLNRDDESLPFSEAGANRRAD
jgi:hypothetical protein